MRLCWLVLLALILGGSSIGTARGTRGIYTRGNSKGRTRGISKGYKGNKRGMYTRGVKGRQINSRTISKGHKGTRGRTNRERRRATTRTGTRGRKKIFLMKLCLLGRNWGWRERIKSSKILCWVLWRYRLINDLL